MRSSSVWPSASNRHNSTLVACAENKEKLVPRPSQKAPRGWGRPSRNCDEKLRRLKLKAPGLKSKDGRPAGCNASRERSFRGFGVLRRLRRFVELQRTGFRDQRRTEAGVRFAADAFEAHRLVEFARGGQIALGPQGDAAITRLPGEVDTLFDQHATDAVAARA